MRYLIWLAFATSLPAQDGMGCIKEMMVPTYTNVARRSAKGGEVRAGVTIGWQGVVNEISTGKADENLAQEVRNFLSTSTTYGPRCQGKKVALVFAFSLEGEAEPNPRCL